MVVLLIFKYLNFLADEGIILFFPYLDFVGFPVLSIISGCIPRVEWLYFFVKYLNFLADDVRLFGFFYFCILSVLLYFL
jgi:hypothetical protein